LKTNPLQLHLLQNRFFQPMVMALTMFRLPHPLLQMKEQVHASLANN
jgi:hypothetical protein